MSTELTSTPAKFYYNNNWVKFSLIIGEYDNLLDFLNSHNLLFLENMKIDFTNIPTYLYGKGYSITLLDYFANNTNDVTLLFTFSHYFIDSIIKLKYDSDEYLNYDFIMPEIWQNMTMKVFTPYIPITTTTTTTFSD